MVADGEYVDEEFAKRYVFRTAREQVRASPHHAEILASGRPDHTEEIRTKGNRWP